MPDKINETLEQELNVLRRKQKLSQQVLDQHNVLNKKYQEILSTLKEKEHLNTTIVESNKNAIIAINEDQIVTIFNKSAEAMFGFAKEDMLNQDSLYKIIPEHLRKKHRSASINFMNTRVSKGLLNKYIELEGLHKDGSILPVRIGFGLEVNEDKILIIANIEDITQEKKDKDALKEMNIHLEEKVVSRTKKLQEQYKYLQTIIDGVHEPIMVIHKDYSVALRNKPVESSIDTRYIADMKSPKCYEISHQRSTPCDSIDHPCPLRDVLETHKHTSVVHEHKDADGNNVYVELSASPLFDSEKECIGIIESTRDITAHLEVQDELREQKDILFHQANHDSLTGLANRIFFNDRLEQALRRAKRNKTKLALFFIDLDHFKEINDSLGHEMGDEVLKSIAQTLEETLRNKDSLARLGGDEFTLIIDDLDDGQDASPLAQKIIETLINPISINEHTLYISCSIGISIYPDDGSTTQDLLKYADSAMYKAKSEGRNNFQYYASEMTDLAMTRVVMESSLRKSLENEDFIVYYQAQMNAKTNTLIGMEALVRWQHPTMGLIYPNDFIPLAESTGLIIELDRFVMKTAMTQIAQWHKEGLFPGILAMNLSVTQLKQRDFLSVFEQLLSQTGCQPEWLELEITESQIMTNPQEAIKVLQKINDIGVRLSIDDFGTGYSSLSYLKRLPINKLKIDQSFIRDLPNDEDSSIVQAIISLASTLQLQIIAEGVETQVQREFLIENGCKSIQGYLYTKPIPAYNMHDIFLKGSD